MLDWVELVLLLGFLLCLGAAGVIVRIGVARHVLVGERLSGTLWSAGALVGAAFALLGIVAAIRRARRRAR